MKQSLFFLLIVVPSILFSQNRTVPSLRYNKYRSSCENIIQIDPPRNISGLYARWDASDETTILDENSVDATMPTFTGKVRYWNDASGNGRNLSCFDENGVYDSAYLADYSFSDIDRPAYLKNSEVISNSEVNPKELRSSSNFLMASDFTFVFVMKANNAAIGDWNCFISSSNSANDSNSWQFGYPVTSEVDYETGLAVSSSPRTFCVLTNVSGSRKVIDTYIPYNNEINVWVFKCSWGPTDATSNVKVSYNGVQIRDVDGIRLQQDLIKLFRNRNNSSKFNASFYEFFVYNTLVSDNQIESLSYWLACKWGVTIE